MRPKIDINKLKHLLTSENMFVNEYGAKGTASCDEFDAKSRAWYYVEGVEECPQIGRNYSTAACR